MKEWWRSLWYALERVSPCKPWYILVGILLAVITLVVAIPFASHVQSLDKEMMQRLGEAQVAYEANVVYNRELSTQQLLDWYETPSIDAIIGTLQQEPLHIVSDVEKDNIRRLIVQGTVIEYWQWLMKLEAQYSTLQIVTKKVERQAQDTHIEFVLQVITKE